MKPSELPLVGKDEATSLLLLLVRPRRKRPFFSLTERRNRQLTFLPRMSRERQKEGSRVRYQGKGLSPRCRRENKNKEPLGCRREKGLDAFVERKKERGDPRPCPDFPEVGRKEEKDDP